MGQSPLQTCGQATSETSSSGPSGNGEFLVADGGTVALPYDVKPDQLSSVFGQGESESDSALQAMSGMQPRTGSFLPPNEINLLVGDDICAICLEPLQGRAQTIALCGHIFHRTCLNRCSSGLCPQCRSPIDGPLGEAALAQSSPSTASSLNASRATYSVGTLVVIHGLQNHTELNGTRGRVVQCHEMAGRYEVRAIGSGHLFRVKAENLMLAEAQPSSPEETPPGQSQLVESTISPDSTISTPAATLDGPGASMAASNRVLVLEPGMVVRLTGLRSAMRFNGRTAEIISIDRVRSRCEIRLEDGSIKTIAADNLEVIAHNGTVVSGTWTSSERHVRE